MESVYQWQVVWSTGCFSFSNQLQSVASMEEGETQGLHTSSIIRHNQDRLIIPKFTPMSHGTLNAYTTCLYNYRSCACALRCCIHVLYPRRSFEKGKCFTSSSVAKLAMCRMSLTLRFYSFRFVPFVVTNASTLEYANASLRGTNGIR